MITSGSFSGHFELSVFDANTGKLTKRRSFRNLITNQGLASYCGASPSFYTAKICVGNGTNAPTPEDMQLGSFLAVSNTDLGSGTFNAGHGNNGAPDYVSWTKGTARFNAGTFDGVTITEVGVTNGDNSYPVFARALILDDSGNPTSLTILANEYLDVTYTLFYHPVLTDSQFSFEMNGVTYTCTARAAYVSSDAFNNAGGASPLLRGLLAIRAVYNSQTLGEVTGEPIYSTDGKITCDAWSYSSSNVAYSTDAPYTHKATQTIATGQCNFDGGIGAMVVGNYYIDDSGILSYTQISFAPKLPKDSNTEMTFTFAKTVSRYVAPTP